MRADLRLVEVARRSDTGRVRSHNEDRFLVEPPLLLVADGMGGAQAGEVAAGLAVDTVGARAGQGRAPDVGELSQAVRDANRSIREMAERDPERAGMGTTLTAALVAGEGRLEVLHVGDSRAYLLRGGRLRQLTEDHSVVAELVRTGHLSPAEAESHPQRNVITRALGAEHEVTLDQSAHDLRPGDVLLLCTDGLSSYVREDDIARTISEAPTLDQAAARLVGLANAAGGADNVTVVLARADEGVQAAALPDRPESGDTGELPLPAAPPPERPITRIGRALPDPPAPARQPRVLQQVGRRRRRLPILAVALVVLLLGAGAAAWVASRTYFLSEAGGTVRVDHGFPLGVAGVDLSTDWQDTGVSADRVRAAEPGALDEGARGQGDAVEAAVRLVWRYGLPEAPRLDAPPATRARPGRVR